MPLQFGGSTAVVTEASSGCCFWSAAPAPAAGGYGQEEAPGCSIFVKDLPADITVDKLAEVTHPAHKQHLPWAAIHLCICEDDARLPQHPHLASTNVLHF